MSRFDTSALSNTANSCSSFIYATLAYGLLEVPFEISLDIGS